MADKTDSVAISDHENVDWPGRCFVHRVLARQTEQDHSGTYPVDRMDRSERALISTNSFG
jgi:hypothetical protein